MKNLQELPRFGDKLSYLYVERAVVDQSEKSIAIHQGSELAEVPAASLAVLILGPGTTVTHSAVKTLGDSNCQIIWAGENGVRFYAHGLGGARHSRNLIRQAALVSNENTRLQVVVRMYVLRFGEKLDPALTLQQLRGKEGIRVRQAYAEASRAYGVPWSGRSYRRDTWGGADPINRALSAANACLYGLVHAAILSGGYSPALGFIHTGKQLSFVYDVADLYKTEFTIPAAFEIVGANPTEVERQVRIRLRDRFRAAKLMERVLPDIQRVLEVPGADGTSGDPFAEDAARPAALWEPVGFSAETAIGRILEFDPADGVVLPSGDSENGCDDSGKSDALDAG